MADEYLRIARRVLLEARVALSAREILDAAYASRFVPKHLHGRTQHKTLQARLSEDIGRTKDRSLFCRTRPGRFILRQFLARPNDEFLAPVRRRQLRRESVLVVPRKVFQRRKLFGFIDDQDALSDLLSPKNLDYLPRVTAETNSAVKQIVAYLVVKRGASVLSYRRGKYSASSPELQGARSVGFSAHVTQQDIDLFDNKLRGISNACVRELHEELGLAAREAVTAKMNGAIRFKALLNLEETSDCRHHIAAVNVYSAPKYFEPLANRLPINGLGWMDLRSIPNNLNEFEPWSRAILEDYRCGGKSSLLMN